MKDILIFLRSGETITNEDVSDEAAKALEEAFMGKRDSTMKIVDSTGCAMFHVADVAAIVINDPPKLREIGVTP